MKKRTLIVIVVLIVVALIAAACVYGYVSGRQQTQEEPPVSEPEKPAEPEGPDTPDKPDEEPVQPDNPNPSGGESVIVYVPDEQGETLTPVGADAKDDSDQALVDALIAANSLPAGVEVQSSSVEDSVLKLDMNGGPRVRHHGREHSDLFAGQYVRAGARRGSGFDHSGRRSARNRTRYL